VADSAEVLEARKQVANPRDIQAVSDASRAMIRHADVAARTVRGAARTITVCRSTPRRLPDPASGSPSASKSFESQPRPPWTHRCPTLLNSKGIQQAGRIPRGQPDPCNAGRSLRPPRQGQTHSTAPAPRPGPVSKAQYPYFVGQQVLHYGGTRGRLPDGAAGQPAQQGARLYRKYSPTEQCQPSPS